MATTASIGLMRNMSHSLDMEESTYEVPRAWRIREVGSLLNPGGRQVVPQARRRACGTVAHPSYDAVVQQVGQDVVHGLVRFTKDESQFCCLD